MGGLKTLEGRNPKTACASRGIGRLRKAAFSGLLGNVGPMGSENAGHQDQQDGTAGRLLSSGHWGLRFQSEEVAPPTEESVQDVIGDH